MRAWERLLIDREALRMGLEVSAAMVTEHERQVQAWRETRGPRAMEPPASPVFIIEGGVS